jgi:rSAM/selenodomain-associated transferase 1
MDSSQIILLLKHPRKGGVKTRLGRQIGDEVAVDLYRNFILDILSTMSDTGLRRSISFYPPGAVASLRRWLGHSLDYYPQRGRDHPERLMNTFVDAFSRGEERVVVLASDVPDLPKEVIAEALSSLENSDAVIGPSPDGGYYLIGFRRRSFRREPFQGIAWSTPRAFDGTVSRMGDLEVHRLPPWPDVDTLSDLQALVKDGRNPLFRSSRTMAFLKDIGLAGP